MTIQKIIIRVTGENIIIKFFCNLQNYVIPVNKRENNYGVNQIN